ncbi:hypothetical protein IQ268_28100 [Oculatella sp. LEGE 06141]|uniref:hypothetical protein n=1 Tax=Oculatella sp. LEGE 06141 TaxID=1828648 RepID=UPI0018804A19|nr:hypothetical protein [Oculatella sp. LEGE 06141]MBE9182415.1 hypothetical protein [Oculatella sp. LEGE 06141]
MAIRMSPEKLKATIADLRQYLSPALERLKKTAPERSRRQKIRAMSKEQLLRRSDLLDHPDSAVLMPYLKILPRHEQIRILLDVDIATPQEPIEQIDEAEMIRAYLDSCGIKK